MPGHYEITFKRPHWDNADRFIRVMEEICAEYKARPEEEGVFGDVFDGFVKHNWQEHRLRAWRPPREESAVAAAVEAGLAGEEASEEGGEGSGEELDPKKELKRARAVDTPARWVKNLGLWKTFLM